MYALGNMVTGNCIGQQTTKPICSHILVIMLEEHLPVNALPNWGRASGNSTTEPYIVAHMLLAHCSGLIHNGG